MTPAPSRRSKKPATPVTVVEDPYLQVRLVAPGRQAFEQALDGVPIDFACAGPRIGAGGEITANVLIRSSALDRLREQPDLVRVEVVGDFSATLAARRLEVGTGNRFADPQTLPVGLGVLVHADRS